MLVINVILSTVLVSSFCVQDVAARGRHELDSWTDYSFENLQASCASCISAVGVVQTLVKGDASYEELVNASTAVCYQLVPSEGWDPDTLCSLAIDTYAPHVIYIMNVTEKSPRQICTLFNNCPLVLSQAPLGVTTSKVIDQRPPAVARWTAAEWKAADYEGTLRLVHVTDIHTDYLYSEGSATQCEMPMCCRADYNGTGSAPRWGDYPCNIPHRTVDLFFSDIARRFRPHILANTGDTVQHTVWDQPLDQTIDVDRYITERIAYWMPDSASYLTYGNHDVSPTNLFYANRNDVQELNEAVFNHWKPLSGFGDEQWATFSRGAYYTIEYRAGLRIVAYNSNYGSTENFYNILNIDELDYSNMKQFLETTFESARQNGDKVILLGHHPTGSRGYMVDYEYFITNLQARYSDVIVLHLLGHSHSDSFSIVRDYESGEARGVQISSASMTSYTDINPSYRVIYIDPDTFQPLDMDTFHLDLSVDSNSEAPEVKFVYRASDEYGMPDLTASSFNDFVNRMETDSALLEKYRYNLETRVYRPDPCDDQCRARTLCRLRNTDFVRLEQCYSEIGF